MIKINLLEKKKPFRLPVVMGVDLNEVKIKPLIATYLLSLVVDAYVTPTFTEGIDAIQAENTKLNKELKKHKREVGQNSQHNQLLQEYEKQITKLKDREVQVAAIIEQKTNPKNILLAISKITPEGLWLDSLSISEGSKITIQGSALKFNDIKRFVKKANELAFFGGTVVTQDVKPDKAKVNGREFRLQKFSIEATISSYGNLE
jgi:Tfp pilus assembly protein PilN